jgi:TatD DNase family protein
MSAAAPGTGHRSGRISDLVDIGINLAHDSYDPDRAEVLARARAAGVTQMIVTGSSLESTRRAIELARAHPGVLRATAGVHPHHAADLREQELPDLEALMRAPEVAAAGECGLDYFRNFAPHDAQQRAFHWQLELATRTGRPVFLHQRDAHADFMAILRQHLPRLSGGVAHCFTGNERELADCLDAGLSIGITGWICDERRGAHLKALVRDIPADRLMLETDGPYLLPRDIAPRPASRRNEPMYLPHVLKTVADSRGESADAVAASTTRNARRFFGLAGAGAGAKSPETHTISY